MSTQEFLSAQVEALQKRVKELEQEVKWAKKSELEAMNHFHTEIEDLQKDNNKLVEVIKGLDPTNPILQHLTI